MNRIDQPGMVVCPPKTLNNSLSLQYILLDILFSGAWFVVKKNWKGECRILLELNMLEVFLGTEKIIKAYSLKMTAKYNGAQKLGCFYSLSLEPVFRSYFFCMKLFNGY